MTQYFFFPFQRQLFQLEKKRRVKESEEKATEKNLRSLGRMEGRREAVKVIRITLKEERGRGGTETGNQSSGRCCCFSSGVSR